MRKLLPILFLILPFTLSAAVKVSITNGSWFSPGTWSPGGVPGPADDVYLYHNVSFNQNITLGGAVFHIDTFAQLVDMGTDSIFFGGDDFRNLGFMSVSFFALGAGDSAVNRGDMNLGELAQSGDMFNYQYAAICISQQLVTSDNFVNDGSVSAASWFSTGVVTGTIGRFCIANSFVNSGQISGTIDICDATPGQPGDINTGTIAGTVTNCQALPCESCAPIGLAEYFQPLSVTITPHPVASVSVIEFEIPQMNSGASSQFIVTDVSGRIVRSMTVTGMRLNFDRTGMDSGIYFYQLVNEGTVAVTGKLMIQ